VASLLRHRSDRPKSNLCREWSSILAAEKPIDLKWRYVMISAPDGVLLELFEFDDPSAPANVSGRL